MRRLWLPGMLTLMLLLAGCRGAAGRAAALPQPTDLGGWIATALFLIGIWWLVLKITRG